MSERIARFHGDPFGQFIYYQYQHGRLTSAAAAAIFGRLVVNALLDDDTPEMVIERWAIHAARYGRLALAEERLEQAIDRDTRAAIYTARSVDLLLKSAFGGAR